MVCTGQLPPTPWSAEVGQAAEAGTPGRTSSLRPQPRPGLGSLFSQVFVLLPKLVCIDFLAFSTKIKLRSEVIALTGQVPADTNITTLEIDPDGITYLGHADHQVPCGLRPSSRAAIGLDFCREDQLKGLKTKRGCHGE